MKILYRCPKDGATWLPGNEPLKDGDTVKIVEKLCPEHRQAYQHKILQEMEKK